MNELKDKISELIKETDKEKIVEKLQEINDLFLTTYKLEIKYNDKTITILPVETEIYFFSCKNKEECAKNNKDKCKQCEYKNFHDGMIHNNDLQKNHFGKLYFHRIRDEKNIGWGKNATDPIDLQSGGVDVCISDSSNYYLSILIRSACINGLEEKNLVSGINKICKEIIKNILKDEQKDKCIDCLLKKIEKNEDKKNIVKERNSDDKKTNTANIFHQPRIAGNAYSNKDKVVGYEDKYRFLLNSLNKGKDNEILEEIIKSGQNFYKNKKIKDFEKEKDTLYK